VTDSVFAGTQTSANDVFLVTPIDADRISADDTGNTVTVVPKERAESTRLKQIHYDRGYRVET